MHCVQNTIKKKKEIMRQVVKGDIMHVKERTQSIEANTEMFQCWNYQAGTLGKL